MAPTKKASATVTKAKKSLHNNSSLMAVLMLGCTLVLVLSFVLSKQLVGDISFNNKVIKAKNKVNATLKKNVDTIPELKKNFEELSQSGPQPKDILEALPTTSDYPALAGQFETVSALSGVRLVGLTLESGETAAVGGANPQPQPVLFRATIAGSYERLQQLLANLEKIDRPMVVTTTSFSGSDPDVILEIGLTSYWQPPTEISDKTETLE